MSSGGHEAMTNNNHFFFLKYSLFSNNSNNDGKKTPTVHTRFRCVLISSPRGGAILYTPPSPPPRYCQQALMGLSGRSAANAHTQTHIWVQFFSYNLFCNIVYLKKINIFLSVKRPIRETLHNTVSLS